MCVLRCALYKAPVRDVVFLESRACYELKGGNSEVPNYHELKLGIT